MKPTEGIAVDASCRGGAVGKATGVVEWRGVDIATGKEVFRSEIFPEGTISQGEYAAILDGMKWALDNGYQGPIYSDSEVAIAWCRSTRVPKMHPTPASMALCERIWGDHGWAELEEVRPIAGQVAKWRTHEWGENPADLGYKGYQKIGYWAIASGRMTGLRNSWRECADLVIGYVGARFRFFRKADKQMADAWLSSEAKRMSDMQKRIHALSANKSGNLTACAKKECSYPSCLCGT